MTEKIILSTASLHLSLAAAFFVCYQVFLHKDFTHIEFKKKNIPREGGSSVCMWEAYRKTGK